MEQLLRLSGGKLSLKTVLIVGLQIVDRIERLHGAGFLFRDMRPDNFLIGLENKSQIVHIINFGKSKRFRNKENGKHMNYR
jgi:casein kinase 1